MYPKIGGMTGTAVTEAAEFYDIYKINVVTIPTNLPVQRIDQDDEFYKNQNDKFAAITTAVQEASERGQPVLVGQVSIEKSEILSEFLTVRGVVHPVLNARYHEQEKTEEHTSELQSLMRISYAVFCLKKKKQKN